MKSMLIPAVIIVLAVIAGLSLLKPQNAPPPASPSPSRSVTPIPAVLRTETAESGENVLTVEMEAGSFYYKPNIITAKKGEKIRIILHSVSMMHDFTIDELAVKSPLVKNGDTATFEFTPDRTGTFQFYCSVGQHRQAGQVGTLTVE